MLNKQPQVIDSCSNRTSNCLILDGPCMLLHVMHRLLPFVQTSKTTNWAVLPIVGVYRYWWFIQMYYYLLCFEALNIKVESVWNA